MRDVPHVPRSTNMEMAYVILWLFGGLLYLQSTFACDEDSDCPYAGERCCKSTETGKELAKGICMMRTCGGDVCRTQYDCLPNKRCDASQTSLRSRCTTLCYGDHHCEEIYGQNSGYICSYSEVLDQNQCEKKSDSTIKLDSETARFIYISCAIIGFCLIFACLRHWRTRRQSARQMATRNAALIGRTKAQERRNVGSRAVERPAALQMTSIQTHEQSNGPASDAIAGEGPPSYMEVGDVPQSPPPTYEEATKV